MIEITFQCECGNKETSKDLFPNQFDTETRWYPEGNGHIKIVCKQCKREQIEVLP